MAGYIPAPFRRYLALTKDPNSPSGSNLDVILGNTAFGITADTADFPSGVIPDMTSVYPVKSAGVAWGPTTISFADLITGVRAAPPDIPFKILPTFTFVADLHRYLVERIIKSCMGLEGSVTGGTYEIDSLNLGSATAGSVVASFVWNGTTYTTAPIAWNATASAVQSAMRAATGALGQTLPSASITVSGGPLPAACGITMSAGMAGPVTAQTATPTGLTGGTVSYTRGTPGVPFTHPISGQGFGASQLPLLMAQLIEDAINYKMTGLVVESFQIEVGPDGPGTITVEAHPLYTTMINDVASPTVPTGINPEPGTLPMLARDMTLVFQNGSAEIGVSAFKFGWKNNNTYTRTVDGACVETVVLDGSSYKLWHPCYHRITGRQSVSWGFTLLDSAYKHEVAMEFSKVENVVAKLIDPSGGSDAMLITLPKAQSQSGGIPQAAATGDLSADFTGAAFYDPITATDCTVAITNNSSTAI